MGWALPTAGACHAAVLTPHRIRARSSDNARVASRPSRGAMPAAGARVVPSPHHWYQSPSRCQALRRDSACAYLRNPLKSCPAAGFAADYRRLRLSFAGRFFGFFLGSFLGFEASFGCLFGLFFALRRSPRAPGAGAPDRARAPCACAARAAWRRPGCLGVVSARRDRCRERPCPAFARGRGVGGAASRAAPLACSRRRPVATVAGRGAEQQGRGGAGHGKAAPAAPLRLVLRLGSPFVSCSLVPGPLCA